MYVIRRTEGDFRTYRNASGAFVSDISEARQYKYLEPAIDDLARIDQSDGAYYDIALYVQPKDLENAKRPVPMPVKKIRALTGLSRQKFGEKYFIPWETIKNWESGKRIPPDYVLYLLERVVRQDFKPKEDH